MAVSTAISLDRISRVLGYKIRKGVFQTTTQNLPQRIAILAEANTAEQSGLLFEAEQITSAQQAGETYGYGSPIHQIMRILRPVQGGGVGSVPTVVYPQEEADGAVAAERTITVTGTASETAIHNVVINGRTGVDGENYTVDIVSGDTEAEVASKISDAINNVLGAPVTASSALGVVTLTSKWAGATSDELSVEMRTNGTPAGLTYATADTTTGSGTADISDALDLFGNTWNTIVINSYNTSSILDQLETFNGRAGTENPTGRFTANIFKPFVALFGSKESTVSAIESITDARLNDMTNVLCPAPNSDGFSWEAAANCGFLFGPTMNNNPHLDISGRSYPDMPTANTAGDFAAYENRDQLVKAGASTVDIVDERYQVQDFVTTYHPTGENPAQFRYPRNLMIDFNVKFGLFLLKELYVIDHAIAGNDDTISVGNVIKPKQWRQILENYANDLSSRNLIVDAPFMQDSINISTGETNPDRLETFFRYKRSPYARVVSTTAEAGFAFGLTA